jgi:hypothetical protein
MTAGGQAGPGLGGNGHECTSRIEGRKPSIVLRARSKLCDFITKGSGCDKRASWDDVSVFFPNLAFCLSTVHCSRSLHCLIDSPDWFAPFHTPLLRPTSCALEIAAADKVDVVLNRATPLEVKITREGFDGDVQVKLTVSAPATNDKPKKDLFTKEATIKGADPAKFELQFAEGDWYVAAVHIAAGALKDSKEIPLTIRRPDPTGEIRETNRLSATVSPAKSNIEQLIRSRPSPRPMRRTRTRRRSCSNCH